MCALCSCPNPQMDDLAASDHYMHSLELSEKLVDAYVSAKSIMDNMCSTQTHRRRSLAAAPTPEARLAMWTTHTRRIRRAVVLALRRALTLRRALLPPCGLGPTPPPTHTHHHHPTCLQIDAVEALHELLYLDDPAEGAALKAEIETLMAGVGEPAANGTLGGAPGGNGTYYRAQGQPTGLSLELVIQPLESVMDGMAAVLQPLNTCARGRTGGGVAVRLATGAGAPER